jgi:hypothetical protein
MRARLTAVLLVLLLCFVLRRFTEGFSSFSGLEWGERMIRSSVDEYPSSELSIVLSKLGRVTMGSMHAPNIDETIIRNPTADRDANTIGKRDTRPLQTIRHGSIILMKSRLTECRDEQQDPGLMLIQCLFRALHLSPSLSNDHDAQFPRLQQHLTFQE